MPYIRPEAKLSPPPTRSSISRSFRNSASWKPPFAQQIAPQSFIDAVLTVRSVVATSLKFGYTLTASLIIFLKLATSSEERFSSRPSTEKPSAAVKSSSLPIITSTSLARERFTSIAFFWPPMDFHNEER